MALKFSVALVSGIGGLRQKPRKKAREPKAGLRRGVSGQDVFEYLDLQRVTCDVWRGLRVGRGLWKREGGRGAG